MYNSHKRTRPYGLLTYISTNAYITERMNWQQSDTHTSDLGSRCTDLTRAGLLGHARPRPLGAFARPCYLFYCVDGTNGQPTSKYYLTGFGAYLI